MQQIIAKDRTEAQEFCEGGKGDSQRIAYWAEDGRAFKFERLPGETSPTWQADVEGYWWDANTTVGQKLGLKAAPLTVTQVTCLRCGHTWLPRSNDVRQCPGCKSALWNKPKVK